MRNSTVVKAIYNGNDVTRRWSIPFEYIKTEEIGVILTTTILGNDSEEVVSTDDYTIDTDTNEVVYPSDLSEPPVETGKKVTIYRTTDLLQKTDFTNQGAVWPEAIEDSLDKLHQIVQEHTEEIGRAFKTNKSSSVSPEQYAEALIAASDAAVTAASNAAISETNAGLSETAAGNSATAAYNSQVAAASSETNAGLSATAAGNSATAAYNSQVAAASSETNAGLSATAAHNSELAAASSETNAGNSATAAGNSATAAHNSEVAAEAAEGRISDRWGLRKKSTTYAADDMAYHVDLPTGWYLECTTGGTSSASDLVITSPTVGGTVTDNSVIWTIRAINAEATTTDKGLLSPSDKLKINNIPASGGTGVNTRIVITTSGTWTAPVTGTYKVTCIGGGGAGGNGASASLGGGGGGQGGTTTFGTVSAVGGHGGGGGYAYSGGGGGAAGAVSIDFLELSENDSISVAVGAGGAPSSTNSTTTVGLNGSGGATGGTTTNQRGGQGAMSAYGSGNSGSSYSNCASYARSDPTGAGGSNGYLYGGGGGGGCYATTTATNITAPGSNGVGGNMGPSNASGGAGGNGAVIIEYFQPA